MIPLWRNPRPGSISPHELSFRVSVKLGTSEFHRKGGNSQCPGPAPSEMTVTTPWPKITQVLGQSCGLQIKIGKKKKGNPYISKKSSRLIDHSLSHFSPVLVREDQEHFNRSILPGLFFWWTANPKNSPVGLPPNGKGFEKPIAGVYRLVLKVQLAATWGTLASLDGTWHQLASKSFPWKVLPGLLRRTYVFPKKIMGWSTEALRKKHENHWKSR